MAVAFKSAGTLASASTTVNVPIPAGVASGDLMVMQILTNSTVTTPSGWTKLFGPVAIAGSSGYPVYVFTRVSGGSEPSTVSVSTGGLAAGIIAVYSGTDPTTPIDVFTTAGLTTSVTTMTSPSVTTTKANTLLARIYWAQTGGSDSITPPGTDTERYDAYNSAFQVVLQAATSAQASTGASGTTTATCVRSLQGGLGATLALAPPTPFIPVADFTGTPLTGAASLSVAFTDTSTNTPTSWAWDFGDGTTSTSQNPSHSYTSSGVYTVSLTATNAGGSNTKTRTAYITATEPIAYAAGGGIEIY